MDNSFALLCVFARGFLGTSFGDGDEMLDDGCYALKGRNKYRIRQRLVSWELGVF